MPPTPEPAFAPATVAVSAGRPPRSPDGPSNPPLVMASTYHAGGEVGYGRYGNPTWEMLESAVGALEGGVATSFASGMAAVTAALDLVPLGGVVVAAPDAYYGSLAMLRQMEQQGRLTVRQVDLTDADSAAAAVEGAALVWAESPTNPMLRLVDIEALAARATAAGALLVVDSTFATPVLQRPLEAGADVVVHSATKYLSGHSDLLLGIAVAREVEHRRPAGRGPQHPGLGPGDGGGMAGPARAAHPAPAGGAGLGERRGPRHPAGDPPDGLHGPLPGPGRDGEHRAGPQPRGRRGDRAGPPVSGCTRRVSAASSPASSGAVAGPERAPTYRSP